MKLTISQIAKMAGVSRGTVDRVIHHRGRVSKETEERINKIIEEYHYEINGLGSVLARNKSYLIGVILIESYNPFFQLERKGIEEAIQLYKDYNIELELIHLEGFDENQYLDALDKLNIHCDALVLVGHNTTKIINKVNEIVDSGKPVLTLTIDLFNSHRTAYIGIDDYKGGKCIGGIVKYLVRENEKVLLLSGDEENQAENARLRGFYEVMADSQALLSDVYYTHDNPPEVYHQAMMALSKHEYQVVCAMGYGVHMIGKAIDDLGLQCRPLVVGFDLVDDHKAGMLEDKILYLVDQCAYIQSKKVIECLCEHYIHDKPIPSGNVLLPMQIYNKYNV